MRRRGAPPPRGRIAVWLLPLLILTLISGPTSAARAAEPHPQALGLSLTATPTSGSAPLAVAFDASLTPNTTVAWFNWSFGDGATYNVSAVGSSAPVHSYSSVGAYTANVSVHSAAGNANASVRVTVVAETLAAAIAATPTTGSAPLTVHFTATISGGTGTYDSILWNFGDGDSGSGPDLNYTFPVAGTFLVNLTVTDSSGHSVSVQTTVSVAAVASSSSAAAPSPLAEAVPYVVVAAALLAVTAGAAVGYRAAVRRRAGEVEAPLGALTGPPTPPEPSPPSTADAPAVPAAGPSDLPRASGPSGALDESRRLSERLLIHLLWYGHPGAEGGARVEASQQGMARALNSGQNTISKALSRLVDAGAVRVELSHVPGAPRRVKTYSLTPRGEAVARSIARGPGEGRPPTVRAP